MSLHKPLPPDEIIERRINFELDAARHSQGGITMTDDRDTEPAAPLQPGQTSKHYRPNAVGGGIVDTRAPDQPGPGNPADVVTGLGAVPERPAQPTGTPFAQEPKP